MFVDDDKLMREVNCINDCEERESERARAHTNLNNKDMGKQEIISIYAIS